MPTTETTTVDPRKNRKSVTQQVEAQELELQDGETAIRYRDLNTMYATLQALTSKHLPTKEARIHLAGCLRALKPHIEDYQQEQNRIRQAHQPSDMETAVEGQKVDFIDPIGMQREFGELDWMVAVVRLPRPITDRMLPTNDKAHPANEDGLSLLIAELGPLYELEIDYGEERQVA